MNKTKYVMAKAGMRNSAGEAICVVVVSLLLAGVVFTICGQQCFEELVSSSVLSYVQLTAVMLTVGMFLVYISKSLANFCWAFSRSLIHFV